MREALSGLTTRGRSFLAAGAAAALCALVLGQRDLARVAVLVAALPLASALVVARTRYRVACTRRLNPTRLTAGSDARVLLDLANVSRIPTGIMLVEDKLPYVLGTRPRFVLDRVEPRGRRQVAYRVRSDIRGRYVIGPLTIRLTDPFGMCELTRGFSHRDSLTVTPVVHALEPITLGGEWSGSGESQSRSVAAAGEDDVAPREYRDGDDRRRIHWRSTARYGDLMVRREERPWQSRATILLDTRGSGHRGEGAGSSFEWAVSAAASIGIHLSRLGYIVQLVTDAGIGANATRHNATAGTHGDFEGFLLDALAVITPSPKPHLDRVGSALRHTGGDGLIIAVLGAIDHAQAELISRLRRGTSVGIALLLDTTSWLNLPDDLGRQERTNFDGNMALLRQAGWRVVAVRAGDRLTSLWPQAGRGAAEIDLSLERVRTIAEAPASAPGNGRAPSGGGDRSAAGGAA